MSNDDDPMSTRASRQVLAATWVGAVCAAIGFFDGLAVALNRHVVTCADGTFFPNGATNFDCHSYPQAGLGIAIAALSVVLGILVVFCGTLVRTGLPPKREPR